jgi:hypothetical protein
MNIKLVENWRQLWKAWVMRFAALGIALPELMTLLADNTVLLPMFDDSTKNLIRLVCLVCVVLSRPVKQDNLASPTNTPKTFT